MNISKADSTHRMWCCGKEGEQQAFVWREEIETPVESATKGSEITRRILVEVEGMITTQQTGLEIAERGIDPLEFRDVFRLDSRHHGWMMTTTSLGHSAKQANPSENTALFGAKCSFAQIATALSVKPGTCVS